MQQHHKDNIICRILSGKLLIEVKGKVYVIHQPDDMVRLQSQLVYNRAYESALFEGWLTKFKIKKILIFYDLIDKDVESKIETAKKTVDGFKKSLYQNRGNPTKVKEIRKSLTQLQLKCNKWYDALHSLDYTTVESYADDVKNKYLLFKTLTDENGKPIWETENKVDLYLLQSIILEIGKNAITVADYRELARTEPWSSYWRISKGNPFSAAPVNWTEEQKTISLFSQMYDNVYQHTDCPELDVINDDDMLDGWLLTIKEEQEKEKTKKKVKKKEDKHQKATEMYIPVASAEEAVQIHNMNTMRDKVRLARRSKIIQEKGRVKEAEFPDVKTQIVLDAQQQALQAVRDRKRKH